MDRTTTTDLDNYIAGHSRISKAYRHGCTARKRNRSIKECRCKTITTELQWRMGWIDEDMAIRHELDRQNKEE